MIKKFKDFITEAISGTELVGPVGPAYGETRLQNKTLTSLDTDIIYCELDGNIYTRDEYNDIYQEYLKNNGKPLIGFSKENLDIIVDYLQGN